MSLGVHSIQFDHFPDTSDSQAPTKTCSMLYLATHLHYNLIFFCHMNTETKGGMTRYIAEVQH
jgi:hypothetical protein